METPANLTFHYLEDGWDEQAEIQGKELKVYIYKTPPLDFKGEDIFVEFQITTISGESPKLYARFCEDSKTPEKCGLKPKAEYVTNPEKSKFQ